MQLLEMFCKVVNNSTCLETKRSKSVLFEATPFFYISNDIIYASANFPAVLLLLQFAAHKIAGAMGLPARNDLSLRDGEDRPRYPRRASYMLPTWPKRRKSDIISNSTSRGRLRHCAAHVICCCSKGQRAQKGERHTSDDGDGDGDV